MSSSRPGADRDEPLWGVLLRREHAGNGNGDDEHLVTLIELAMRCECHPEQVHAWLQLGVIEAAEQRGDQLLFRRQAIRRLERGLRLRHDLGIGLHALGLVLDLLERVEALEDELRRRR